MTPSRLRGLGAGSAFRDKAAMTLAAPDTDPEVSPAVSLDDAHRSNRAVTRLSIGVAVVLIALKAFALGASGSVSILASLADSALEIGRAHV